MWPKQWDRAGWRSSFLGARVWVEKTTKQRAKGMVGRRGDGKIGDAVPRREDLRLLRGRGRYSDDVNAEGQAYAVMVRSPHAHARIRSIDSTAARAVPGVLA